MWNSEQKAMETAQALSGWYEGAVRGLLEAHASDLIAPLDEENARLQRAVALSRETAVCFVGGAGIGKSTLLNAIIAGDRTLVPAGGIGPLTALATEVRYRPVPALRVEYQPRRHLWMVAATLNFEVRRQQKAQAAEAAGAEASPDPAADAWFATWGIEAEAEDRTVQQPSGQTGAPAGDADADQDADTTAARMDEHIRMAALLVAGGQHEARPVEYLADALAVACEVKPRWGTTLSAEDARRVERIRTALAMAERGEALVQEQDPAVPPGAFLANLKEHAAGFLAPLIRRIEVGWPSELLASGLVLVDLPGVGVASDVYQRETQSFVRERARAVVLVTGRSGPMEADMELLRSTGYWDRLLVESDEPEEVSCALLLVVTHVDDVALARWRDLPRDEDNKAPKTKREVFAEVREEFRDALPRQLDQQLRVLTRTEGSELIRDAREEALRKLMRMLEVHPLSAIEHRRALSGQEDDPSFLTDVQQSGVGGLVKALTALAGRQQRTRVEIVRRVARRFASLADDHLASLAASCAPAIPPQEAARARAALRALLAENNEAYEASRAAFREFLSYRVPQAIESAAQAAREEAQLSIDRYLEDLQRVSWSTLRAAVVKGGAYHGSRHIDLPGDVAQRFQEPVAAAWSQSLLRSIREQTRAHAGEVLDLVLKLCDQAEAAARPHLSAEILEVHRKLAIAQAAQLEEVGDEAADELRQAVKTRIAEVAAGPIRDACKELVRQRKHQGMGARQRVLALFKQLAAKSSQRALEPAVTALMERYRTVSVEIYKAVHSWGNPVERPLNAFVASLEDDRKAERERLLAAIRRVREAAPWLAELQAEPEAERLVRPEGESAVSA